MPGCMPRRAKNDYAAVAEHILVCIQRLDLAAGPHPFLEAGDIGAAHRRIGIDAVPITLADEQRGVGERRKLAQDGWISAAAAQEGNRPLRRVYRLTEAGEAAFQRLLRDNLEEYTPVNFSGDIGLAFLDWMPPEEALPLLEAQKAQAQSRLDEIRAIPAHAGSLGLIFSHQIHHIQAELNWLEYVLTVIEKENK